MKSFKIIEKCPKPFRDTGCTFCNVKFPSPIKQGNLNSTKVLPWKHLLILSHGYSDINDLPKRINHIGLNRDIESMLNTNGWKSGKNPILSSFIFLDQYKDERSDKANEMVYLYPDNVRIEFHKKHLDQFCYKYLKPDIIEQSYNPFARLTGHKTKEIAVDSMNFQETKLNENVFLVCGHTQRDARCGVIAPYLIDELRAIKKPNDKIGSVSHIGGHDYAGNLIIYPENLWYGRVMPDNVQGIYESLKKGEIIKELYRGDL